MTELAAALLARQPLELCWRLQSPSPLSSQEKQILEELLQSYKHESQETLSSDLESLSRLTSEIKAINNQATILHGERIKKAQEILKNYRDGAFSCLAHGNLRQSANPLQFFAILRILPPAPS